MTQEKRYFKRILVWVCVVMPALMTLSVIDNILHIEGIDVSTAVENNIWVFILWLMIPGVVVSLIHTRTTSIQSGLFKEIVVSVALFLAAMFIVFVILFSSPIQKMLGATLATTFGAIAYAWIGHTLEIRKNRDG